MSQLLSFPSPLPIITLAARSSRRPSRDYNVRQSLFIYPGIIRTLTGAFTIYGYTNTTTFTSNSNSTTVFHSLASNAGSDDASGTLWIHDDFGMYIVNVNNTFGLGVQVIALS
ncbi:hypothetical protein F5879DRAFT_994075 [Lentinula edodes]|nr:hypothetical protein F5879DRAFT_994075 [Lentinula edodes]